MRNFSILSASHKDRVEHIRDNSVLAGNKVTYKSDHGLLIADFGKGTFTAPEDENLGVVNIFYHNAITLYVSSIMKKVKLLNNKVRLINHYLILCKEEDEEEPKIIVRCKNSMKSKLGGEDTFAKGGKYVVKSTFDKGLVIIDEQEARHYITQSFFEMYFEGNFSDIYQTLNKLLGHFVLEDVQVWAKRKKDENNSG